MSCYRATTLIPPLVRRALDRAERDGFERSCTSDVGRLLATLAASRHGERIAEFGTGYGVGAAWIVSTLPCSSRLLTVELEPERAAIATQLLADASTVKVFQGDWTELLPHGPFGLIFADAARSKQVDPNLLHMALKPGGILLIDDLTPEELWPEDWRGKPDAVREIWLNDERFAASELRVSASAAVIVATRLA